MTRPDSSTEITTRNRDGSLLSVTGTGVVPRTYGYAIDPATGNQQVTEYIGPAEVNSPRWTATETDLSGRVVKITRPGFSGATLVVAGNVYSAGLLRSTSRSGSATLRFEYDTFFQPVRSGLDLDNNGVLDALSSDRITETPSGYVQIGGNWYRFERKQTYNLSNNGALAAIGETQMQLSNLPATRISRTIAIDAAGNQTVTTVDVDRPNALVTETTDPADSTLNIVRISRNGLLLNETTATVATSTKYVYDAVRRFYSVTTPKGLFSYTDFIPGTNQVNHSNDPVEGATYTYHPQGVLGAGKVATQTDRANHVSRFGYDAQGRLVRQWGDAGYPQEFVYDGFGDLLELHTYRAESGWDAASWPAGASADVTTWVRQPSTGLLTAKQDAAGRTVSYTYEDTADQHVKTRTWARGVMTTYNYESGTGELITISYSDATPGVILTYDRRGRVATVIDAAGSRTLTYDTFGRALNEDFAAGGLCGGLGLHRLRDGFGGETDVRPFAGGAALLAVGYTYRPVDGRLDVVSVGDVSVTYGYEPDSNRVGAATFRRGANPSTLRVTSTRLYDTVGRSNSVVHQNVQGITLASSAAASADYDGANRRTKRTLEDGTYWQYLYDTRGEVTSGVRRQSGGGLLAGWQFGYTFDAIGNRLTTTGGGDSVGGNQRTSSYTLNSLNQYDQRSVPGYVDVLGLSTADASITVNGFPVDRQGAAWREELAVDNSTSPVALLATIAGTRGGVNAPAQNGKVFVPKTPETFQYDDDGNLLGDGRWSYSWDAENRLRTVTTKADAVAAGAVGQRVDYTYDYRERRVGVTRYQSDGTVALPPERSIYDDWNLIAELDSAGNIMRSYTWGLDISATRQGAAGVGGLSEPTGNRPTQHAVATDENGNVTALIDTTSGALSAKYDYSPFGELLRITGPMAASNPFRFSTKYQDGETGLLYFGCRYYQPQTGRWLSRDPIGELGGVNPYGFGGNDGINRIDMLGLLDSRSKRNIGTLYSRLRPLARQHLEKINGKLAAKCMCFKITQALRTVAEQNNIPSANTRARGLTSYHVWGLAYDITLFKGGGTADPSTVKKQRRRYGRERSIWMPALTAKE